MAARVRIEWLQSAGVADANLINASSSISDIVAEFAVAGTAVRKGPSPGSASGYNTAARITALDAPVLMAWGDVTVDVTGGKGVRIEPGQAVRIDLGGGAYLSFIQALVSSFGGGGGGGGGASLSESLWTDDTNAYFVRVDNGTTITWTDIAGTTVSAPGTGARPVPGPDAVVDKTSFQAVAAGTGYSVGDLIDHIVIINPTSGVVVAHYWNNLTTELKLASAPSSANIVRLQTNVLIARTLDLDETKFDVKTSPCSLYKLRLTNRALTARYVKLYNAAAASVTVGTTVPVDTIILPAASSTDLPTILTENFGGVAAQFDTALSMAAVTGLADNNTGAPGTNDVVATAYYK